LNFKMLST